MGKSKNMIEELKEVDCETMTVVYEWCGVRKERKLPKDEAIAFIKKIQARPQDMRVLEVLHPRAAA